MPIKNYFKGQCTGNSLVVQWLELSALTATAQVQSLVGELRSHKLHHSPKITEKKRKKSMDEMLQSKNVW